MSFYYTDGQCKTTAVSSAQYIGKIPITSTPLTDTATNYPHDEVLCLISLPDSPGPDITGTIAIDQVNYNNFLASLPDDIDLLDFPTWDEALREKLGHGHPTGSSLPAYVSMLPLPAKVVHSESPPRGFEQWNSHGHGHSVTSTVPTSPPPAYTGRPLLNVTCSKAFGLRTTSLLSYLPPHSIYIFPASSSFIHCTLPKTLTILFDSLLQKLAPTIPYTPTRHKFLPSLVQTQHIDPQETLTVGKLDTTLFTSLLTKVETYATQQAELKTDKSSSNEGSDSPPSYDDVAEKKEVWNQEKVWKHSMLARNIFIELILAARQRTDEKAILSRDEVECALAVLFMVIGYGVGSGMELGEVIDSFLIGECKIGGMGGKRVWGCRKVWEDLEGEVEEAEVDWGR